MKVSKKQQAAWDKKNTDRMNGHVANNQERDLERQGWVKDEMNDRTPKEQISAAMTKEIQELRAKRHQ